jgi:hypothetical protein
MTRHRPNQVKTRCTLGTRINQTGVEMFPCSSCEGSLRKCYVSVDSRSKRCGECVKHGLQCDVEGPSVSDWASLERAEDEVSRKLAQTTSELHELLARQSRLMKQQEFFKTRAKEMLRRGLNSLDELDAQEEKEKKEKEDAVQMEIASTAAFLPVSELSSEGLLAFESSLWGLVAGGDEMPPVSRGS